MLYWYCLILQTYCDELCLPTFHFTKLAFTMQGRLYIWLQNWWGNSHITTQQIYGPLVSSCTYIFAFLSRPGYFCNLLILVHSRCYCITFLFCAVVILIYCWPLAHGSTWCHLLCFVFDNLSIKLNLLFGWPGTNCLLDSPLFIQIRSMHLSGTLSRLPGLFSYFICYPCIFKLSELIYMISSIC
jgi:hypothetical protein